MPPSSGIELRLLRYFLAVYEELHFGRAAERLHIAQPPLSQAIRKLEQELGVVLFLRTSRAVEATPAADALAEEARKVLASFEFAVSETRQVGRRDVPMRIGCVSFLPTARLQQFLAELQKRDAALRTEVARLWELEQVARLRAGGLDLGVFMHVERHPELEWEPLFPGEELSIFLPRDHPLAEKDALTPEDTDFETLLTYPRAVNPVLYDRYMTLLAEAGYRFRALHEMNAHDPRDVLLAIAGGLGVACGPASLPEIAEEGRSVIGLRLDPPLRLPEIVVAWRASPPRGLRSRLQAVREAARELHQATAVA